MEIACADCGCVVDRGAVVDRCPAVDCCCSHLPITPNGELHATAAGEG